MITITITKGLKSDKKVMSREYQTMNLFEDIFKFSLTCLHSAYEVRILDEFLAVVLDKIFHFIPPN